MSLDLKAPKTRKGRTPATIDPDNKRFEQLPGEPLGHDLLKHKAVSAVLRSRWYPGVFQIPIAAVFGLVAYELLAGPPKAHDNAGTALMWVLWWPLLPIVYVLFGWFWCAVCPFAVQQDQRTHRSSVLVHQRPTGPVIDST